MNEELKIVPQDGEYATDFSKGSANHQVSSQWYSRPEDQRFCSLGELHAFTKDLADTSMHGVIKSKDIRVQVASSEDEDTVDEVELILPAGSLTNDELTARPTHWSFGQLSGLVKAPAGYLRSLPAQIAGINLQYGLSHNREEVVKAYTTGTTDDGVQFRAITGPKYGRIYDHEIVKAVQRVAGNGVGDSRWKVPGTLNWGTGKYDPNTPVTKNTTTLFASDRDVFMFLVDDRNPIDIGTTKDGNPDLIFRGFFIWNSEVGSKSFGISTMYMRGVCANRILWGVENFQEITFRHSSGAPDRFAREITPVLNSYAEASQGKVLAGIQDARNAIVADDEDSQVEFLRKRKFSEKQAKAVIKAVVAEEGHEPKSIWDFVQGITAVARTETHQDVRVDIEKTAGKLLDAVAA